MVTKFRAWAHTYTGRAALEGISFLLFVAVAVFLLMTVRYNWLPHVGHIR